MHNFSEHPLIYVIPLAVAVSLAAMWVFERRGKEMAAFLSSCAYIAAMLAGVAAALYPSLLPSSGDPARDITIYNAATGEYALRVGLIWWGLGMCLAFGYFVFVYRMFRGKVRLEEGHGYCEVGRRFARTRYLSQTVGFQPAILSI
jgi:cytochrome bd ubiquinol oxidase subunit II